MLQNKHMPLTNRNIDLPAKMSWRKETDNNKMHYLKQFFPCLINFPPKVMDIKHTNLDKCFRCQFICGWSVNGTRGNWL